MIIVVKHAREQKSQEQILIEGRPHHIKNNSFLSSKQGSSYLKSDQINVITLH